MSLFARSYNNANMRWHKQRHKDMPMWLFTLMFVVCMPIGVVYAIVYIVRQKMKGEI